MPFTIYLLLTYGTPLVLVAISASLWWRGLSAPWLFAVAGFLALIGLQSVLEGAWSAVRLAFGSGGFFLQSSSEAPEGPLLMKAAVISALTLLLGFALLSALRHGLSKL